MSPYLSDCMPDERVAIQPPSVEWVKLSGKWPNVQPRALSCSSRSRAEARRPGRGRGATASSISSTRSMPADVDRDDRARLVARRPRGCRRCCVPPPNGISTASASSAARMIALDLVLVCRADDDVGQPAEVAARAGGRGRAGSCRARGRRGRARRSRRGRRRRPPRARRAGRARAPARGRRARRSRRGARRGASTSTPMCALDERRRASGLSSCVKATLLVAPAPPLHLAHRVLCSALCPGPVRRGSAYRVTPAPE